MSGPITMTLENVLDLLTKFKDEGIQPKRLDYSDPLFLYSVDDQSTYDDGIFKVVISQDGVHLFSSLTVYYLNHKMFSVSDMGCDPTENDIFKQCLEALDFKCFKVYV